MLFCCSSVFCEALGIRCGYEFIYKPKEKCRVLECMVIYIKNNAV